VVQSLGNALEVVDTAITSQLEAQKHPTVCHP